MLKINIDDGDAKASSPSSLGDFWSQKEKNFFNCLAKIDQSKMYITEKKYYSYIAEILFKHTKYFEHIDTLKNFWLNKNI